MDNLDVRSYDAINRQEATKKTKREKKREKKKNEGRTKKPKNRWFNIVREYNPDRNYLDEIGF